MRPKGDVDVRRGGRLGDKFARLSIGVSNEYGKS